MASGEPQSWAEAMKQYENEKRNGHTPPSDPVTRFHRTTNVPLGDYRNPEYPAPSKQHSVQTQDADRYSRHGWGGAHNDAFVKNTITQKWQHAEKDAAMAANEEQSMLRTERKLVPGAGPGAGANRPPPKGEFNPHGRSHLFEHLKYSPGPAETEDSWMGTHNACAAKGKLAGAENFPPLSAAKGRTDLFDVIDHAGPRKPGDDSNDAWMGTIHYDPQVGRQCPVPPFMLKGRRDLYDTIQQTGEPRFDDNGSDSWIGNRLIDPSYGRSHVDGARRREDTRTGMFDVVRHKEIPAGSAELLPAKNQPVGLLVSTAGPGLGKRTVEEETKDINSFKKTMEQVPPDGYLWETDVRGRGREHLHTGDKHAKNLVGRENLFGTLSQNPGTMKEDPVVSKKMVEPIPGTTGHASIGKGSTMLHWPGA